MFGSAYLVTVLVYRSLRSSVPRESQSIVDRPLHSTLLSWLNIAVTVVVVLAAVITHHLRHLREQQFERARILSQEMHIHRPALALLDAADQWPSTAKPGRIDYLRAWTYEQLGDRRRAEECYLRSDQTDPTYFWNVVDTAAFYAASPEILSIRQQRVEPYIRRLRENFASHPRLEEGLARIEKRLTASHVSVPGTQ